MEAQGMEGPMTSTTFARKDANIKDGILVNRGSAHASPCTDRGGQASGSNRLEFSGIACLDA